MKSIKKLLLDLDLISEDHVRLYSKRTRDNVNLPVWRCDKSGIIFIDNNESKQNYYEHKIDPRKNKITIDKKEIETLPTDDDHRRHNQFNHQWSNKRWLDFGSGSGALLELSGHKANQAAAVELNQDNIEKIRQRGFDCHANLNTYQDCEFDVISLFHVLEHLESPIEILKNLKSKMNTQGKLIIEVPHANDFLLSKLNLTSFKNFTLWSEHLILHTKNSLKVFLTEAGFSDIELFGFQRYGISNHVYWMQHGKPGGHIYYNDFFTDEIDAQYRRFLIDSNISDTIIATARNI